jgi:peptidoglycan/xylan/chitin deacetylase (PgdA/CDA1 family)
MPSKQQLSTSLDRSLRATVKVAAGAADLVKRPQRGIVILLYHRVGASTGSAVDLPAADFDQQMQQLAATGKVMGLEQALTCLSQDDPCDGIVVTFDDGTPDLVDIALPILVRHSIPSTWYVATSFVDESRPFAHGDTPLSWSALRDACSTDLVTVGSHTHTHRLLDRASDLEITDELDRSIGSITDHIGVEPLDFAYPKAMLGSQAAEAAVRERFRSAALAGTRANVPGQTDPYRLARSPIQVHDGHVWFERKLAGGMGFESTLRDWANRLRYARAST